MADEHVRRANGPKVAGGLKIRQTQRSFTDGHDLQTVVQSPCAHLDAAVFSLETTARRARLHSPPQGIQATNTHGVSGLAAKNGMGDLLRAESQTLGLSMPRIDTTAKHGRGLGLMNRDGAIRRSRVRNEMRRD